MNQENGKHPLTTLERAGLLLVPILLAVGVLLFGLYVFTPPEAVVERSYSTAVYNEQGGDKLIVASGGEIEVQSGGTVDFQSGATVGLDATTLNGALTGTSASFSSGLTTTDGDVVVADDLRITAQTSITVTNGSAFTVTGTYQPITAAGEVTPTITAGATAGDLAIIVNTSAQTINIADSGTAKLTAAFAMGQYDSLTLLSDGTNWIEVARANN